MEELTTVNSTSMVNITFEAKIVQDKALTVKLSPSAQILFILLYGISIFLTFTGNTLVIFVELYGRRSARNLRKFLINLSISDIIYGVLAVPFNYNQFIFVSILPTFCTHSLVE